MCYIIEKNTELAADIDTMVKKDNVAQLLMGDELKQDQFEFFYNTAKIIYDSALCSEFINMKVGKTKQGEIIETQVIPEMIAFHSILRIRDIQLAKAAKAKKDKIKAEQMGESSPGEEVDPNAMTEEQIVAQRLDNEKSGGIALSYDQLEKEADKKDRKEWGRLFIWEGYFNPKIEEKWLETAEALKHVNKHVCQDIEDYILLKGLKGAKNGTTELKGDRLANFIE